jgi:hypothetical protein
MRVLSDSEQAMREAVAFSNHPLSAIPYRLLSNYIVLNV